MKLSSVVKNLIKKPKSGWRLLVLHHLNDGILQDSTPRPGNVKINFGCLQSHQKAGKIRVFSSLVIRQKDVHFISFFPIVLHLLTEGIVEDLTMYNL